MNEPIVVESTIEASPERIWDALTNQSTMVQWYFEEIPAFQPSVGFETSFVIENDGRTFTHRWCVTQVIPRESISYTWRYDEYPTSDGSVTFELIPQTNRTLVRLTCEGIETFPDDVPEFHRDSCLAGWEYFIKDRLKSFFETPLN
ncbi:MAG: SRPBCC domain-containing protein [Planctomycetota bacterium]